MNQKLIIIVCIALLSLALAGVGYYLYAPQTRAPSQGTLPQGRIVEEKLEIPDTASITGAEGRIVEQNNSAIPLVPKNDSEKIIVPGAVLSVKGSYDTAKPLALTWASDAKLVFVKSLGAITLEGKSSQWQLAFTSQAKKGKGYEIIIQADRVVSKKEIESSAVGADTPKNWKDAGEIIKELQTHPLYQNATISAINFYLNPDNKRWYWGFATSVGTSSIAAE